MPEVKYYEVEQTRKVQVTASSTEDAAVIAAEAFKTGQPREGSPVAGRGPGGPWGHTTGRIETTQLTITEKR